MEIFTHTTIPLSNQHFMCSFPVVHGIRIGAPGLSQHPMKSHRFSVSLTSSVAWVMLTSISPHVMTAVALSSLAILSIHHEPIIAPEDAVTKASCIGGWL
jgi:hypothetical protein